MEIKAIIGLLLLIAPGFLAGELKNHLRYVHPPAQFEKTVQAILFSALAYITLLLIDGLLSSSGLFASTGWYDVWNKLLGGNITELSVLTSGPMIVSYTVVLVVAVVEGIVAAHILNTWWDCLIGKASHRNHYQRVWDELFVRKDIKPPLYVSLLMKDGSVYHGLVDRSSDVTGEKELLLREVYRSGKDDELMQKPARVAAPLVYISESNIQALFVVSELQEKAIKIKAGCYQRIKNIRLRPPCLSHADPTPSQ